MRFKGKVSWWFYAVVIGLNLLLLVLSALSWAEGEPGALLLNLLVLVGIDLLCIPVLFHNFVELQGETLLIVFGLIKKRIPCRDIVSLRATKNPLSSLAASLDRVEIQCKGRPGTMIAVEDQEGFFRQMQADHADILIL